MINSVKNRRTIRKYKNQNIESTLLTELLSTASRVSTMGNMQLYSVVVTQEDEMKARLAPAHFNQPMVKNAPVVLTFCADFNRFTKWCEQRNAVPGYANFLSFVNATTDALLYAQNFCTLAEEEGLGICYLGTVVYNPQQIIDALSLPKLVFPVATITVGYPDECPNQPDRLPIEGIVHYEHYSDYSNEIIDELYAFKEALSESKKFVAENNKETLAQVYTDVRYTKDANESMSERLLDVLRNQGFLE